MSTAGKVLVVLVTLSLLVWIVLFAGVAQLNANWAQKVNDLDKQTVKLREDVGKLVAEVRKNQDETSVKQRQLVQEATVLRTRLADAEKALYASNETLSRYRLQLEGVETTIKDATTAVKRHDQEVAEAKKQLADEQARVKRFQAENGELLTRHSRLQKDFLDLVAQNKRLAEKASSRGRANAVSLAH